MPSVAKWAKIGSLMFCQKCGTENQSEADFCMKCGIKLSGTSSQSKPSDVYFWSLALFPIILGIIAIALSATIDSDIVLVIYWIIAIAVNVLLVVADSNELKKHGLDSNVLIGILLIPVYLYRRAKALKSPQTGLIVWFVAFFLSFLGQTIGASNVGSLQKTDYVETYITDWLLENEFATADVFVLCPDTVLFKPQTTFMCSANSSFGDIVLQVTVENVEGDVTWKVVG
jgi:hypothetical protein